MSCQTPCSFRSHSSAELKMFIYGFLLLFLFLKILRNNNCNLDLEFRGTLHSKPKIRQSATVKPSLFTLGQLNSLRSLTFADHWRLIQFNCSQGSLYYKQVWFMTTINNLFAKKQKQRGGQLNWGSLKWTRWWQFLLLLLVLEVCVWSVNLLRLEVVHVAWKGKLRSNRSMKVVWEHNPMTPKPIHNNRNYNHSYNRRCRSTTIVLSTPTLSLHVTQL
jgi:hypothetical protein